MAPPTFVLLYIDAREINSTRPLKLSGLQRPPLVFGLLPMTEFSNSKKNPEIIYQMCLSQKIIMRLFLGHIWPPI